jgi:hypothetical protein
MILGLLMISLLILGCTGGITQGGNFSTQQNQNQTQIGCTNNNPPCASDYTCINNVCIRKEGCLYNNPPCGSDYDCINNSCIVSDKLVAQQTVTSISNSADIIGEQGYPANISIKVFIPPNVDSITVGNSTGGIGHEIIINLRTSSGITQISSLTITRIAGDLSTITKNGTYFVKVSAEDNCTQVDSMQSCVYIERA